jgi:two-component sensor histidine kinase
LEINQIHKNGKNIPTEVTATFIRNLEGKPISILGVSRDITERKTHEMELIRQFEELKATQKILKSTIDEKKILIKEIHHRVKNNLQVISGILTLHDFYSTNENEMKIIQEFQQRIKAMSKIHEEIYRSDHKDVIDAKYYINDIVHNIENVYNYSRKKNIELNISGDEVDLDISAGLHIGLIIHELVSNSFKHAFNNQESGIISIEIHKGGDNITLNVKDNGSGLPDGFNLEESESLGMKIISTSASQLKGEIIMKSGNGFWFTMIFHKNRISTKIDKL